MKVFDVSGVGDHVAVKIVAEILQRVIIDPGGNPAAEQLCLVIELSLLKHGDGVLCGNGVLLYGERPNHKFPHAGLYPLQQPAVQLKGASGGDKQRVAEGVFHADACNLFAPHHIIKCFEHQEDNAALIGVHTGLVLDGDHLQGAVPVQLLSQFTQLSIPLHQENIMGIGGLEILRNGLIGCPGGILAAGSAHSYRIHALHRRSSSRMQGAGAAQITYSIA